MTGLFTMIRRVVGLHFSLSGGTAKITERITRELAANLDADAIENITYECYGLGDCIACRPKIDEDTVVVIGMPVHVGKIPLPAIRLLSSINGHGAMTVAVVSYGAATYGNALYELYNYAEELGFKVIGAGAFIAKHQGRKDMVLVRPDIQDVEAIEEFCRATSGKLTRLSGSMIEGLRIKPAPLLLAGKMPVHRVSRVSPKAAAAAERAVEKVHKKRNEPEWFL